jgi:caffeoyl-CoA O-methyltransferase
MLTLVSEEIERYAVEHTTQLPNDLEELKEYTFDHMDIPQMLSGPIEGMLLQSLVWATNATRVLEIGTFTGFSSQMMAAALPDDGILVTCDINPKSAKVAREFYAKSPHGRKIDLRLGPALETLDTLSDWTFDVVFIDADKTNYSNYYEKAIDLLAPRGIIAVDNVLWGGRVLNPQAEEDHAIAAFNERVKNDSRVRHVLLPIRDGVMLIRRAV